VGRREAAGFSRHLHAPSICGDNHLRPASPDCPRLLRLTFLGVISAAGAPVLAVYLFRDAAIVRRRAGRHERAEWRTLFAMTSDERAATRHPSNVLLMKNNYSRTAAAVFYERVELVNTVYDGIKCNAERAQKVIRGLRGSLFRGDGGNAGQHAANIKRCKGGRCNG